MHVRRDIYGLKDNVLPMLIQRAAGCISGMLTIVQNQFVQCGLIVITEIAVVQIRVKMTAEGRQWLSTGGE